MTQHTPGPWYAILQQPHGDFEIRDCERDQQGRLIGQAFWQAGKTEANARLMAAAPETAAERDRLREINADLLAALEAVYAMGYEDKSEVWSQVTAAIAKAKEE